MNSNLTELDRRILSLMFETIMESAFAIIQSSNERAIKANFLYEKLVSTDAYIQWQNLTGNDEWETIDAEIIEKKEEYE